MQKKKRALQNGRKRDESTCAVFIPPYFLFHFCLSYSFAVAPKELFFYCFVVLLLLLLTSAYQIICSRPEKEEKRTAPLLDFLCLSLSFYTPSIWTCTISISFFLYFSPAFLFRRRKCNFLALWGRTAQPANEKRLTKERENKTKYNIREDVTDLVLQPHTSPPDEQIITSPGLIKNRCSAMFTFRSSPF